jgi:hypothetical protein
VVVIFRREDTGGNVRRLRRNPDPQDGPDLFLLKGTLDPRLIAAIKTASAQLSKIGIRHALVGGLAVGAYGYVRATGDIDFLIGDDGFVHHGSGLVTIVDGFPLTVGKYRVDALGAPPGAGHLEDSIDRSTTSHGVPILPIEELIFMKLISPRPKDSVDIVELLKLGYDSKKIESYIKRHAPEVLGKLERLVYQASG